MRPIHVNLPKGSPLKEPFRVTLRRFMEVGVIEYYQRKLFIQRPTCVKNNRASVQVYFEDVIILYWILFGGLIVGFAVLVIEVIEFRIKEYFEMKEFAKNYRGCID